MRRCSWSCYKNLTFCSLFFDKVHNPLRLPRKTTSERPKMLRTPLFLLGNVLRATVGHISTSKSGPSMVCFVHFEFEMCLAPQWRALFRHLNFQTCRSMMCFVHFDFDMCFAPIRRALFRHLNFQKSSEHVVFVHFDLEMCFVPQRRATFHLSSGQMAPHLLL